MNNFCPFVNGPCNSLCKFLKAEPSFGIFGVSKFCAIERSIEQINDLSNAVAKLEKR